MSSSAPGPAAPNRRRSAAGCSTPAWRRACSVWSGTVPRPAWRARSTTTGWCTGTAGACPRTSRRCSPPQRPPGLRGAGGPRPRRRPVAVRPPAGGAGHALGVRFRPGGFRAFTGRPVAELADRSLPAADFFGPEADRLNERVRRAGPDAAALTAAVDAFLLARLPAPDPAVERQAGTAAAVVRRIADGPDLHRVDRLAAEFGLTVRQLQRLFAEYVGAPPKWVLRRARLHEAAERADRGATVDWAALAADLGYADQAHFTRDFTAAVGMPPARYAGGGPPGPA
ncbi:helix-turn-helix domain-containing protein [Kitasatospora aburaviensis]